MHMYKRRHLAPMKIHIKVDAPAHKCDIYPKKSNKFCKIIVIYEIS